jgi:hypothetical protein
MLVRRVLLRLPDRPGSLGRVTTLMGRLGIDIHQVRVLHRDGAVATDEFLLGLPGPVVHNRLAELLEEVKGVRVLGAWSAEPTQSAWSAEPTQSAWSAEPTQTAWSAEQEATAS